MKKIVLYNPAISSLNIGDEIIEDACKKNLDELFKDSMYIEISTHLPVSNLYMSIIKNVNSSFVLGSNLLMAKMNGLFRQWDIKIWNANLIKPVILMGVGWHQYSKRTNLYTRLLYKKIFSKQYMHSVRDEYTKEKLNEIGITNVINTGCPTLWTLTKEFCKDIPKKKADKVVFTLTDYNKDVENDKKLIEILRKNYKEIYFWVQGADDYEYLQELNELKDIKIIAPNLKSYDKILKKENIDFIGTRLHGGIRALQNKRRTIIISVDNRATELNKNYNIPIIQRDDISHLEDIINNDLVTDINIPEENIKKWKSQFREE